MVVSAHGLGIFNRVAVFADPGMQGIFINTNIPRGLGYRFILFIGQLYRRFPKFSRIDFRFFLIHFYTLLLSDILRNVSGLV